MNLPLYAMRAPRRIWGAFQRIEPYFISSFCFTYESFVCLFTSFNLTHLLGRKWTISTLPFGASTSTWNVFSRSHFNVSRSGWIRWRQILPRAFNSFAYFVFCSSLEHLKGLRLYKILLLRLIGSLLSYRKSGKILSFIFIEENTQFLSFWHFSVWKCKK